MRYLISLTLSVYMAFQPAFATLNEVDKTNIFSKNMLKNGGFENGKASWTASAGTFAVTTSSPMVGLQHATWDAAASGNTLTSGDITIPAGYFARNGAASCVFTTASGTATHEIQVYDGANILSETTITSSTTPTRTSTNFIFPSSASVSVRIYANADEPSIAIDDCYLGPAEGYNVSNVSQATFVGSAYFATTANCTFTVTSTSLAALSDADCPGPTVENNPGPGTIQTTDANAPAVTVNNLPPGNYTVLFRGASAIGTSAQRSALAINDGTNTYGQVTAPNTTTAADSFSVSATFTYTTAGNRTFNLYASSAANAFNIDLTASNQRLYFEIHRFPTTQETAYAADVTNWLVNVNIAGGNPSLGTATVSTYAGIESASLTLTNHSSATITARIPCSSTNSPSGTTCSAGSESVGVNFNLPKAGSVEACATFGHYFVIASNSADNSLNYTFQLVETASNSQTIVTEGGGKPGSAQGGRFAAGTAIYGGLNRVCSIFKFASAGEKTLRLMYEQVVGGTVNTNIILGDGDASVGGRDIQITVKPVDQSFPAPNLVNSVVSPSSGVVQIANATFTSVTTTAITRQSGNWLSVTTDNGTGDTTFAIAAGTFSAAPTCTCTAESAGAGNICQIDSTTAQSSTLLRIQTTDSAATALDVVTHVICMGPK